MTMRLSGRLFISYAMVIIVGAIVAYVTIRLLAPRFFEHEVGVVLTDLRKIAAGQPGARRDLRGSVRSAFVSALTTALLLGTLASVVAAAIAAAIVTRRLVRPLNAVRTATRLIADGRYETRVPIPQEPELAGIAADVNTLATRLADTEARRSALLGEVAHEMRTPLTALEGYVEGLIDGVFAPEPEVLGAASDELRRLRRLADDLSALSRSEEQRLDLKLAGTDLVSLAGKAATRLAPQFGDADVHLTIDTGDPLPVMADPDRITQVLTNIIGNALTATAAGGSVTVQTRAQKGAESRAEPPLAQVVVTDTGIGLASADLERVFERFYRAPGQSRRSTGSGIGLTIARNIARAHGGDVTAASTGPGQGATFLLSLPLRSGSYL
jgi:signal transduction histidine kinase